MHFASRIMFGLLLLLRPDIDYRKLYMGSDQIDNSVSAHIESGLDYNKSGHGRAPRKSKVNDYSATCKYNTSTLYIM